MPDIFFPGQPGDPPEGYVLSPEQLARVAAAAQVAPVTRAAYDLLSPPQPDTVYRITDEPGVLYLGADQLGGGTGLTQGQVDALNSALQPGDVVGLPFKATISLTGPDEPATVTADIERLIIPESVELDSVGMECTGEAPVGGPLVVDINSGVGGPSILGDKLAVSSGATTTLTSTVLPTITSPSVPGGTVLSFDIDRVGELRRGSGVKVWLSGTYTASPRLPEFEGLEFTVTTTAPNQVFNLLTRANVDYNVNWGDGSADQDVTYTGTVFFSQPHTYATPGTHRVKVVTENLFQLSFHNDNTSAALITSFLGAPENFPWRGFSFAFSGCVNAGPIPGYFFNPPGEENFDQRDMSNAFRLLSFPNEFPLYDLRWGTAFSFAFGYCNYLSFPDIRLNQSTSFFGAFRTNPVLRDFPPIFSTWAPASVANNCFEQGWLGCTSLTAESVENIFTSIDASGQSGPETGNQIRVDFDADTGQPDIDEAVVNLKARGWAPFLNGVIL